MFDNLSRSFFRGLRRNKSYSLLNVLGLGVGIACSGLIFLWAEDEWNFDNVHRKKEWLYAVKVTKRFGDNTFTMGSTPRPMAAAMEAEIPGIARAARVSDVAQKVLLSVGDRALYVSGRYADVKLFQMFSFDFIAGNQGTPYSQLSSIVLSQSAAGKLFGKRNDIIGKAIRINNEQELIVTGIYKDLPQNSSLQSDWFSPYISREDGWDGYGPFTYVELKPEASIETINKQVEHFIRRKKADEHSPAFLFPLSKWRLYSEFENGQPTGGGRIEQLRLLVAIAGIILLIACVNFMNLATARSQKRSKEVGLKKVLGAGRLRLILQFMSESILLALLAALLSLVFIAIALPAFNTLMQKQLYMDLSNPLHIIMLLLVALVCGLIAGVYPAFYLSSFNPISVLKKYRLQSLAETAIRKGLVVFQFTVSAIFITTTLIVYQQIRHIQNRHPGFQREQLLELNLQRDFFNDFRVLRQELMNTGFVQCAALTNHAILQGGNTDNRFRWPNMSDSGKIPIAFRYVSPEFIKTTGMQIVEGRDFDVSCQNGVIINESFARLIGQGDVIGKIIQSPRKNEKGVLSNQVIVGVVKDYVYGNVYQYPGPLLLFCNRLQQSELVYVRLKPGNVLSAIAAIESVVKKINPGYPLEYRFVDDQFNGKFASEVVTGKVSSIFAGLTVLISCMGLFGLAAYTSERRTREIGIRRLLGANVTGTIALLSRGFLQLIIISCIIATPIAWWLMNGWLQHYEYRIEVDAWVFLVAVGLSLFIAFVTVSFHAIRAALQNPVKSLRVE